jgi:hypothetical protein
MNASFTEKKYESSYACIAASILGTRSNDKSREKNGQKKAMLLMLLFILNEEAIAAETKKTKREISTLSLSLSLSYTMTRVSVYMRALVYNEVVFSLFETKTSKKKRLFSSPKIFGLATTNR